MGGSVGHIARQAGARLIDAATRQRIEAQIDYEWSRFLQAGITQEDFSSVVLLARRHRLRGSDALHLAVARKRLEQFRIAGDDLIFWTADEELLDAGRNSGLPVDNPLD